MDVKTAFLCGGIEKGVLQTTSLRCVFWRNILTTNLYCEFDHEFLLKIMLIYIFLSIRGREEEDRENFFCKWGWKHHAVWHGLYSRLDLVHVISIVIQFTVNALKWVLRYLNESIRGSLNYTRTTQRKDYVENLYTKKSLSGFVLHCLGRILVGREINNPLWHCLMDTESCSLLHM
jgi:hypothetical protein